MAGFQTRHAGRIFCCALAAAAITASPAAAFTGDDDILIEGEGQQIAVRTILVSTADLDLATARGNKVLDERVARAARRACGDRYLDQLEDVGDYFNCRDQTLAEARREIERLSTIRSASRSDGLAQTASR